MTNILKNELREAGFVGIFCCRVKRFMQPFRPEQGLAGQKTG